MERQTLDHSWSSFIHMGMLENPQHERPIPCPAHPVLGSCHAHGNAQVW